MPTSPRQKTAAAICKFRRIRNIFERADVGIGPYIHFLRYAEACCKFLQQASFRYLRLVFRAAGLAGAFLAGALGRGFLPALFAAGLAAGLPLTAALGAALGGGAV